jgi:uncharacterized protein YciI
MKPLCLLLTFSLFILFGHNSHGQNANPNYNADLATELGADDYGMKGYTLVILKTGSNDTTDKDFIALCFRGHMANINKLVNEGKLIVAGPLGKNDQTYRGIFILNTTSREEAEAMLFDDPAIKEQLLEAELYSWYGSAALPLYLKEADSIWKSKP